MSETLTPAQRRTLPARRALAGKFSSPEEKSAHFRSLAHRSHERRLVLSGDEAAAVLDAYNLLRSIAERAQDATDSPVGHVDWQERSDRINRETDASKTNDPETVT